jgi:predicted nucleotidyltransferase component of viral defense system
MVNIDLHRSKFINILRGIYGDPGLRTILGFKGGTAAMLFYGLPRFSVDLDFDLLDESKKELVFEKISQLLPQHGILSQATDKRFTLFFLLNYQKGEWNLKIEISKRAEPSQFVVKNYLGISMLVMSEPDMAAGKLAALLTRTHFAARDVFDTWYFLKNNWPINENLFMRKTGLSLSEGFEKAKIQVRGIKKTELLAGVGDVLDNKQKDWARAKLVDELLFYLDLYQSELSRKSG